MWTVPINEERVAIPLWICGYQLGNPWNSSSPLNLQFIHITAISSTKKVTLFPIYIWWHSIFKITHESRFKVSYFQWEKEKKNRVNNMHIILLLGTDLKPSSLELLISGLRHSSWCHSYSLWMQIIGNKN